MRAPPTPRWTSKIRQNVELVEWVLRVGEADLSFSRRSPGGKPPLPDSNSIKKFEIELKKFYGVEGEILDSLKSSYPEVFREIVEKLKTAGEEWKNSITLEWTVKWTQLTVKKKVQTRLHVNELIITPAHVEYFLMRLLTSVKERLHLCPKVDCNKLFIGRPNQKFCTRSCRNYYSTIRFRTQGRYSSG